MTELPPPSENPEFDERPSETGAEPRAGDMPFAAGPEETFLVPTDGSALDATPFDRPPEIPDTPGYTADTLFDLGTDGPSTAEMQQSALALQQTGIFTWLSAPRPPVVRIFGAKRYPTPEGDELIPPEKASALVKDQVHAFWDTRHDIASAVQTTGILCKNLREDSAYTLVRRTSVPEKRGGIRQAGNMHILAFAGCEPLIDEIPAQDQGDRPLPKLLRADQPNGDIHLIDDTATSRYVISKDETTGSITVMFEEHVALRPDDAAFMQDLNEQLAAHVELLDRAAASAGIDISQVPDLTATPAEARNVRIRAADAQISLHTMPGTALYEQLMRSTIGLNYAIRPGVADDPVQGPGLTVTTGLTAAGQRIASYYNLILLENHQARGES